MSQRTLTWLLVGLTIAIWAGPLHLGWYVDRPITDIPTYEAAWRAIFAANVDSAFWLARAVSPGMRARRHGRGVTDPGDLRRFGLRVAGIPSD